jgi:hypothetical protein
LVVQLNSVASNIDLQRKVVLLDAYEVRETPGTERGERACSPGYFERLVVCVQRVARHAYYPGIDQAINQCLEDIGEPMHSGRITAEQRAALRLLVLGITMTASNNAASAA